jgi:Fic family protein
MNHKLEGNPLTKGETEIVLSKKVIKELSKIEREAFNLKEAYNWAIDNASILMEEPNSFVRQLNKMVLEGIEEKGGEYRKKPVKIAGMEFTPPDSSSIPSFMEMFGNEIKEGHSGRSVLEFAVAMHTKLVAIHPFIDANGKTARLLLNAILIANDLPCIIVNYADRERYLNALSSSNKGELSYLLELMIECFNESIDEIKTKQLNESKTGIIDKVEQVAEEEAIHIEAKLLEIPDVLKSVMAIKINEINHLKEIGYKIWYTNYGTFKQDIRKWPIDSAQQIM